MRTHRMQISNKNFILIICLSFRNVESQIDRTLNERETGEDVVDAVLYKIQYILPNAEIFLKRMAYVESQYGQEDLGQSSTSKGGIWRIPENKFLTTQDVVHYPLLKDQFQSILDKLAIDWRTLTWEDLNVPIHSGIAAILSLIIRPESIPTNLESQAAYWKKHFSRNDKRQTIEEPEFIRKVKEVEVQKSGMCQGRLNICIVLDGSGSISGTDFAVAKTFISNLLETFSNKSVKTSFLVYSSDVQVYFRAQENLSIKQRIERVSYAVQPAGGTQTNAGIDTAINMLNNNEDPHMFAKVIMVLTDGCSDDPLQTRNSAARISAGNITGVSVGIGSGINQQELLEIALNDPGRRFHVKDFTDLSQLIHNMNSKICKSAIFVPQNRRFEDKLEQKEKRFFNFKVPYDGLEVMISQSSGNIMGFYSYQYKQPSKALNDGIIRGSMKIPHPSNLKKMYKKKSDEKKNQKKFKKDGDKKRKEKKKKTENRDKKKKRDKRQVEEKYVEKEVYLTVIGLEVTNEYSLEVQDATNDSIMTNSTGDEVASFDADISGPEELLISSSNAIEKYGEDGEGGDSTASGDDGTDTEYGVANETTTAIDSLASSNETSVNVRFQHDLDEPLRSNLNLVEKPLTTNSTDLSITNNTELHPKIRSSNESVVNVDNQTAQPGSELTNAAEELDITPILHNNDTSANSSIDSGNPSHACKADSKLTGYGFLAVFLVIKFELGFQA